ncbi:tudor domain-containing protein 7A [Clupea harengus]|uniref:Tudor domain-containing protein 7A n=1 Tax=Clupea harengus TaxID=7950 RepID=A0A6P8EHH2_CLUHA|nr:tudor domain-containing protein 7A [Clupea harengus]XP_031415479.1 tudor domain-containing protein 7A [Clupea harengus]
MTDIELVKKMLRAVLQSNKNGVSVTRLQSDYRALTGEFIQHRQMGYPALEGFLRSVPSVVRMEQNHFGEGMCFAAVCQETAHMAQLIARQRAPKKTGRAKMVNCHMRVKSATPFMLHAKPRTSLRQPEYMSRTGRGGMSNPGNYGRGGMANPGNYGRGGMANPGNYGIQRQFFTNNQPSVTSFRPNSQTERPRLALSSRFQREVCVTKNTHQSSGGQAAVVKELTAAQVPHIQGLLKQLLSKYSSGVWLSKIPQLYRDLFKLDLHPSALKDMDKWTHVCSVEKPGSNNIVDRLVYPALNIPSKPTPTPPPPRTISTPTSPKFSLLPTPPQSPVSLSPTSVSSPPSGPLVLSDDVQHKLQELLGKYSNGLWAHAVPKLFQEAFRTTFPAQALEDLSALSDCCVIEYPMPDNKKKAILYAQPTMDESRPQSPVPLPQRKLFHAVANPLVPPLLLPKEDYPSVLVVEALSTCSLVIRYIGQEYSQAQEAMEDSMREFYSATEKNMAPPVLLANRLYTVRVEEEEVLRAQVCEVMAEKVKVYYVDHGFSEVVARDKILRLDEKFLKLPFQASTCSLAGLKDFHTEPSVLKVLESQACGRILLAEVVERGEVPLVVLYDTSQEDDVNINNICLKTLQDGSMSHPLQVNSTYLNVSVTNVCSDGTIFCHVPCRGLAKLKALFERIESFLSSQESSELLVAKPFCGKVCLARHQGKWSRVEITNLHGSRVLDILFVDTGVPASVEVIELRDIPLPFLPELITIPFQAFKCGLEELSVGEGVWSPNSIMWLRDTVLNMTDCSMRIARLDESRLVHIYLFPSNSCQNVGSSVNHQLLTSDLWSPSAPAAVPRVSSPVTGDAAPPPSTDNSAMPLALDMPQVGQNFDVFVSVACHPGHFVVQPWQELYKLIVLMGEMILYYNRVQDDKPLTVEKNLIYAAKVENNWHRVLVKGLLTNGLVSVYELDYGKHELVSSSQLRPLINEFRQLPFQAMTAELAGVKQSPWSEEAALVFRNHVEKKPLVARVESVQDAAHPWDRKMTVYLVDTALDNRDIWVHNLMTEFLDELSKAA